MIRKLVTRPSSPEMEVEVITDMFKTKLASLGFLAPNIFPEYRAGASIVHIWILEGSFVEPVVKNKQNEQKT